MKKQKVAVVTDGTSSLTPAMGKEYGLHVAPVYVTFNGQTYLSGVNLDAAEFYRLLRANKNLPTTAPNPPRRISLTSTPNWLKKWMKS